MKETKSVLTLRDVAFSLNKLKAYCESNSFKGYDPYDGLNSILFQSIPALSRNRLARLAWIQLFKRIPLNLRPLVGVKKDYNPKALGLFLSGYCNLYKQSPDKEYYDKILFFSSRLLELVSKGWSGACWGYNFDWQARAFFQPKYTPTVVATTFIGNAMLDAYEIVNDERFLQTSRSACSFILNDLNRYYDNNGNFAFSYSPLDKSIVFNASLLGSRLLARVYSFTKEKELIKEARKSVAFCCDHQREDGSWGYGTYHFHQWVDNFHTGYNLECITDYMNFSGDFSFKQHVLKGFDYYINIFFTEEGVPKYYNNSVYPIDIHAPAQMVITLAKLGKMEEHKVILDKVLNWTIKHMQSDKGYFYYQLNKYFSSRIPYMRWAQAWMFYALSTYLLFSHNKN
ncbi:delta-aminolevulinic acid dehydratase [Adhaeribacter swui]|uniref:Delta-aminolevulinic acid dehydratase n=1 Tax=Adhaeribacter swui TaxID=2086471 RepID=A0A7G7G593_9BACT|nr:delta-aminolevulinic acid dehydratase [Adhaeribacter swui]QNF32327.1 delta-aminolevulinic acid dehydratase [Adhaeribacter swui]